MTQFAEDISTILRVNINTDSLNDALNMIRDDENLSLFTDLIDDIQMRIDETKQVEGFVADALSHQLSMYQQELTRHHYQTGMMFNSFDVLEDSENSRIITNTAVNPFNNFPYPVIFETGSKNYGGDPYVQDSIEALDEDVERAFEEEMNEIWR